MKSKTSFLPAVKNNAPSAARRPAPLTTAEFRALQPPKAPAPTPTRPAPPAAGRSEETGQNRPVYGVVEYRNGFGMRFVAADLTETQTAALCATARELGIRPAATTHFITESIPH